MTSEEIATIGRICDLLRAKGITAFEGGGIKLQFGSVEAPVDSGPEAKPDDPEVCRCGHPMYAHTNGGCLEGCELEQCVDPKKAEAD